MALRVTLFWLHGEKYCYLVHCIVLRFHPILLPKVSSHFLNLFHFCIFLSLEVAFTVALGSFPQISKELYHPTRIPGERRSLRCGHWAPVKLITSWQSDSHPDTSLMTSTFQNLYLKNTCRSSHCGSVVTNPASIHEDAGSIPGFT